MLITSIIALGALFKTIVIRFASNVFVHFAGFEGEYYVYLTEKRVKWAERGDAKMVAIVLNKAPSTPFKDAVLPELIKSLEQTLSLPDEIQSGEDSEDLAFEIEDGLFDRTQRWCADVGISVEQLVLAFIRFCACSDNLMALKDWFSPSGIAAELCLTIDELQRVRAELLEIKQRFGLDKQEAFLEANANITLKEFAAMLHGRDCQPNLTPEELLLTKHKGFVVVYGDSDDRVEFEGAIRAEGHTNPLTKDSPAGVLVASDNHSVLAHLMGLTVFKGK